MSAIEGRRSVGNVPIGVLHLPEIVELIVGEEVVEAHRVAQLCALQVARLTEKCFVEGERVDMVFPILRVVKQLIHHACGLLVLLLEVQIGLLGGRGEALFEERCVVVVHVIHIVVAGIVTDNELRIAAHQLLQSVLHAENAADDGGAFGVDMRFAGEDFGEILHHACGNLLVLLCAEQCEFAVTSCGCIANDTQFLQHFLSFRREFAERVGLHEPHNGALIVAFADEPAAAMSAVMAQVKRHIALGCRRERLLLWSRISQIVGCRHTSVGFKNASC